MLVGLQFEFRQYQTPPATPGSPRIRSAEDKIWYFMISSMYSPLVKKGISLKKLGSGEGKRLVHQLNTDGGIQKRE